MPGRLIVVATPIGNLDDLSPRARAALEAADLVACEDTRRTGKLLHLLGLKKRLMSLHEHNERQRLPALVQRLRDGETVALASDAGTPLLSDPGYLLLREAAREEIPIEHAPGPSAVLAALVLSALPPYPFTFAGFPPPKAAKRRRFFARFEDLGHTLIFFESPHRLPASLEDALQVFGDPPAALGRELTKMHEEVLRGRLSEIRTEVAGRASLKGEFTLVIYLGEKAGAG